VNATHALVAKAFPKEGLSKPPTITATGEIRTSGYTPPQRPHNVDRGR